MLPNCGVRKKTLESPLDSQEIKPVNPKGNQPWIFIGRTDAETKAPVFWPPNAKSQLTGKDPDTGKDWGQEEKGTTEDEMVGWHHRLNGHEFEQIPGAGDGQGGLMCCSPWGCRELDMTEQVNNTESEVPTFPQRLVAKGTGCLDCISKGWSRGPWKRHFWAVRLARGWEKIYTSKRERKNYMFSKVNKEKEVRGISSEKKHLKFSQAEENIKAFFFRILRSLWI